VNPFQRTYWEFATHTTLHGSTHNALHRQLRLSRNASSSQAILNTSRILPIYFRQNAIQIFWSVTNGRKPKTGKSVLSIIPLTNS
jgi:hypothetical protein